ncbi:MAG TPA: amidohydrolase family protein [Solirubrobacteraceae bacterium]|nr:amidohydrolase family protein [Solirubrobacteraceae bacterium]
MSEETLPWAAAWADPEIAPWSKAVRDAIPTDDFWDAHTHIGTNDPDGFRLSAADLLGGLDRAGARGVVFPMHEPDGYPPANDMVLEAAADSGGRLVAFCRVDPRDSAVAEAARCLDAGARGIKLHPRAERFSLDEPAVGELVALAHERRLPVLIHAGRGIPALGRHAVDLAERFADVRLILAHAGICDLSWIWRDAQRLPNLFFDTAWWSPTDLLTLVSHVPPGQVLWASDAPYGSSLIAQSLGLRCAMQAGLTGPQLASVAGGQMRRLVEGEDPLDAGPAVPGGVRAPDLLLERVHAFLIAAVARMFEGGDGSESIALARLACDVDPDGPQAAVCAQIVALLDRGEAFAARHAAHAGSLGRPLRLPFTIIATSISRTPDAPLPPLHA